MLKTKEISFSFSDNRNIIQCWMALVFGGRRRYDDLLLLFHEVESARQVLRSYLDLINDPSEEAFQERLRLMQELEANGYVAGNKILILTPPEGKL